MRGCQGELDELEREEFFRLKKVQGKKERDTKQKEKLKKVTTFVSIHNLLSLCDVDPILSLWIEGECSQQDQGKNVCNC